jgi:hypothetical protein
MEEPQKAMSEAYDPTWKVLPSLHMNDEKKKNINIGHNHFPNLCLYSLINHLI